MRNYLLETYSMIMKRTKKCDARTNFKLPASLLAQLEALSKEQQKTKGAIMREILTTNLT